MPTQTGDSENGSLSVRTWVGGGISKEMKTAETVWDSLMIQVSGDGMDTVRAAMKIDPSRPSALDTIDNVPEGKNRLVEAWTTTKAGVKIHYGSSLVSSVLAGETVPVALELRPVRGSIYVSLAGVPANVDSVFAAFNFGLDSVTAKDKRSAIMYLTLDNIPDNTAGKLVIRGTDMLGKTIYSDSLDFVFYTADNQTLQAEFISKPAGLCMELKIKLPGVTFVSGNMTAQEPDAGKEHGPLVISEIQYYADGDSDYIEIHNPTAVDYYSDSMIIEIINTSNISRCVIKNIRIAANGFFVAGDVKCLGEWADTVFSMDLTITGRWITLKAADGNVMDRVAYASKDLEWPAAGKFHAIETDSLFSDPEANNYGRNWHLSQNVIEGSVCFGTPGK
jgi:hypothetical protein